jgi:hypothetical protein
LFDFDAGVDAGGELGDDGAGLAKAPGPTPGAGAEDSGDFPRRLPVDLAAVDVGHVVPHTGLPGEAVPMAVAIDDGYSLRMGRNGVLAGRTCSSG